VTSVVEASLTPEGYLLIFAPPIVVIGLALLYYFRLGKEAGE